MIKLIKEKITLRTVLTVISWVICAVSVFLIAFNLIRWEMGKNGEGYRLITDGTTLVGISVTTDEDIHVVIPEGIKSIGEKAFMDIANLKTVSLPETLVYIDSVAFARCTALENVTFPDSLQFIGTGAFYECTALSKVVLGKGYWQEYHLSSGKIYYDGCGADDKEIAAWITALHKFGLEKLPAIPTE